MTKHLPATFIRQTADFHYRTYFVELPDGFAYADLFVPTFWGHHKRLVQNDIVRVRAQDGSFDVMLTVVTRAQGGIVMETWPKFPSADQTAALAAGSDQDTDAPRIVNGKPVPRVDHTRATKWRVIGLDNQPHSEGYPTKGEAEKAMVAYMKSLGLDIDTEAAA
jgi:hypothetical protein